MFKLASLIKAVTKNKVECGEAQGADTCFYDRCATMHRIKPLKYLISKHGDVRSEKISINVFVSSKAFYKNLAV